ncbi:hypothetical protein C1H46_033981 [Malus baccata]|uniref:Peptidase A1 domain-containing protein n=1 Tax=Malus baccata TaxID=106549 RepID=A0A540L1Y7_MALBA|nr:hypothetical protein C1H46_033981 [Malus baccata]
MLQKNHRKLKHGGSHDTKSVCYTISESFVATLHCYMKSIEVGGDVLNLPTDLFGLFEDWNRAVIDSGTTWAYLAAEDGCVWGSGWQPKSMKSKDGMSMTILGGGDSFCPPFLVRGWDELVCDLLLIFEPHCRRKLIDESLVLGWLISLKDSVHAALIRVWD